MVFSLILQAAESIEQFIESCHAPVELMTVVKGDQVPGLHWQHRPFEPFPDTCMIFPAASDKSLPEDILTSRNLNGGNGRIAVPFKILNS